MISTLSLNAPIQSGYTIANMGRVNAALQHSTYSISSGNALLNASDNVAAMAIGVTYRGKLAEVRDSFMNIQKSMSLLDTADGGMHQIGDILNRMRGLSSLAQSDALSSMERGYLDIEYQQLSGEIDRIANSTTFGKLDILNGGDSSDNVYLLNSNSLNLSSSLELLRDYSAVMAGDLDIGSVMMTGTEDVLEGRSTIDLLTENLSATDLNNLQSTLFSMSQSTRITLEVKNVRMSANGISMQSTSLNIDITSRVTFTAGALEKIAQGDINFLQELALDAVNEQLRGMSFVRSDRALLKLHSGLDGQRDILFSTADVTLKRLFGENTGSLLTFGLAQKAFELTAQALDNLTYERVRSGSARSILQYEATFLQVKMASFDEIRGLHEDTDIPKATTQFALEQVQMQASIAVLTQTMRLHEDAVESLYEKSWR